MDPHRRFVFASPIVPGLWLGNEAASQDPRFFAYSGVRFVINVSKHIPCPHKGVRYWRIPINDPGPGTNGADVQYLQKVLPRLVRLLTILLRRGRRVLVHCHAGAQRSAAVVCAYLISRGLSLPAAIAYVRKKRPLAFHFGRSVNFRPALEKYTCQVRQNDTLLL